MIKHFVEVIFFVILAVIVLTIFINANTSDNSWKYIDSDYVYTIFGNSSGANINSTATVTLSRTISIFTITGRQNQKVESLNVTVANLNVTNATINTIFNGEDLGNFTAVHEATTSNIYSVFCNSTLNSYSVKAYVTQKAGITLTIGNLTCATSATGGYNLSGVIVVIVIVLAILIFYGIWKKKK